MGIINPIKGVVRKVGDKCPWCNTTDVVKGHLVSKQTPAAVYFYCDRKPICKFYWRQPKINQKNVKKFRKQYGVRQFR
jgi:ssDNA-binding Zn-finger/Zn-ribbon topoisomerase 1